MCDIYFSYVRKYISIYLPVLYLAVLLLEAGIIAGIVIQYCSQPDHTIEIMYSETGIKMYVAVI